MVGVGCCRGDRPVAPTDGVLGTLLLPVRHGASGSLDEVLLILGAALLAVIVLRLVSRRPPRPPGGGR